MVGISALLGDESSAQQLITQIAGTTLRMEDAGAKPLTRPRPFAISRYASPTSSDEMAGVMWDSYVLDKN
jgi:hypothetical protein